MQAPNDAQRLLNRDNVQDDGIKRPTIAPLAEARSNPSSSCRDIFWAILFLAHIGVVAYLWASKAQDSGINDAMGHLSENVKKMVAQNGRSVATFSILLVLLFVCNMIFIRLVKTYATVMVKLALVLFGLVFVAATVALFMAGSVVGGVITLIFGLLFFWFMYVMWDRIPFSTEIIKIVSGVLLEYPAIFFVAIFMAIVAAAYSLVLFFAFAANVLTSDGSMDKNKIALFVFFLFSFYWSLQVLMNVAYVTSSGLVATWYALAPSNMPSSPIASSFFRASVYSFGSICFGSLLVAIIQTLRALARMARRNSDSEGGACIACIAECILSCLEGIVEFINSYAYVMIAIYGESYTTAASNAWNLIKSTFVATILQDDVTGLIMFVGIILMMLSGAASGWILSKIFFPTAGAEWAYVGLAAAIVLSAITFRVIEAAVVTMWVCYLCEPAALNASKPDVYNKLNELRASRIEVHV